ncbi:MAG TPA: hypothetical protein VGG34_11010 [Opitutaceae bacterium]|jgi:hypothetical protein
MQFSRNGRAYPAQFISRVIPRLAALAAAGALILPGRARACACGCGIYEVGTASMLPGQTGSMLFLNYAYQDQDQNWSGSSEAPAADNPDRDIRTSFYTFAYQQVFNTHWSLRAELPYEQRHFETTGGASGQDLVSLDFGGVGDARVEGIYTTTSRSDGVIFGLKLPTGSYTRNDAYGDIDRDTEIGSGSTDALIGGFHRFTLGSDYRWTEYVQGLVDAPLATQAGYRPGTELDGAVGVYYTGWFMGGLEVAPIAEMKVAFRGRDTGPGASSPVASGYSRLLAAPGIELNARPFKVSVQLTIPVCQRFTGNQLVAPVGVSLSTAYSF